MKILIVRTFPDILDVDRYNVQEIGLAKALTLRGHTCGIALYNGRNPDREECCTFEQDGREYTFRIYRCKGYSFFRNGFMPAVRRILPQYDVAQVHEYDQLMSWELYTRQQIPTVIYHGPYYNPYAKGYNLKCRVFDTLFLPRRRHEKVRVLAKSEMAAEFLRSKGFSCVRTVGVGLNTDNLQTDRVVASGQTAGEPGHANASQETAGEPGRDNATGKPAGEPGRDNATGKPAGESDGANASEKPEEQPDVTDGREGARELLYVGKIEERRNVYFLLEVFRKLRSRKEKVHLTIIGSGEAAYVQRFLEELRPELEEGTVTYVPKAAQRELAAFYHAAELFLFPTQYDIFGMVLLEAMYCGLPAVSSRNGGSATLIENGTSGVIVPEFDACAWAEEITKLLADRNALRAMGAAAAGTIEEHFTWDRIAEAFEEEYRKAAF